MGTLHLSKQQYGVESTRGTAVAATRVLACAPKAVPMDRIWTPLKSYNGRATQYNRKRNDEYLVRDTLTFDAENPLYYQALPVLHQCSLDGTITPTETTGSQSDYKWDVAPSFTAANAPDTITLEMGDDVQAYEVEHVMFDKLKIAGQIPADGSAAPVTGEFSYFGRQLTPTTFTAAQSVHSGLEYMNAKLARIYSDTTWAGVGGTELASILRGFELEIVTGNEPKFFGSANKYFSSYGEGMIGATLTLDLEGNSTADALFDLYQAGTERALQLVITGSQIGTGVNYKYLVSLYGYFAEVVPLNQFVNSNTLHRALFVAQEDSSGNMLDIDIITNHNTL